jgi:alkanesulfonate monooxygenase
VREKGPRDLMPIRMGGLSGTALKVAGRHADVFELSPGTPADVARIMERVRVAAAEFGRTDRIRFALPVRLRLQDHASGNVVQWDGSSASIARRYAPYAALGIAELVISGLDTVAEIEAFGTEIAPVLRDQATEGRQVGYHRNRPNPGASTVRTYLL